MIQHFAAANRVVQFFSFAALLLQQESQYFCDLPLGWYRTGAAVLWFLRKFERKGESFYYFSEALMDFSILIHCMISYDTY